MPCKSCPAAPKTKQDEHINGLPELILDLEVITLICLFLFVITQINLFFSRKVGDPGNLT